FGKHNDSFKKEFLETHNQYRKQHQAPELRYSDELCSAAQKWADHLLSIRSLAHSDTENGENVLRRYRLSGLHSLKIAWYSEIKDYNFSSPGFQYSTGHFTQVVWKSSTELGVGLATDGNTVFVVGQYKPSGNITNAGYYEKNVLPKI
uniref:Im:7150988 n=1 Tax=Cyprinus carpio TaxID=7962 RepID=A0A8C1JZC8_CYPCA